MLRITTDGSCKGNPGPMGWAAIITRDDEILQEVTGGSQEKGTNNVAEFNAIILGLNGARNIVDRDEPITVVSDSELCIGYLSSRWRSKAAHLGRLRLRVRQVERELGVPVTYEKGGINDELFQLVDVLAKGAVPVSSVALCSMCPAVATEKYWSNAPFPEGWDKNGEGGQWRCHICVAASTVPQGYEEKETDEH